MAMGNAFDTDVPMGQVIDLAYVGLQLSPGQIFSQSIGPWQVENWITPGGAAVLLPRHDKIKELLDSFYGPIDHKLRDRISATRIEVLNGSQREQADQLAASALGWAGFQIAGSGTAGNSDYAHTQVIVYNADEEIAALVAQTLDMLPSAIHFQPDPASPVDIRIVLGTDYDPCAAN
jgi:hypothetical protein